MTDRTRKATRNATIGKWGSSVGFIALVATASPIEIISAFVVVWAFFACTEIICRALEDHTHD